MKTRIILAFFLILSPFELHAQQVLTLEQCREKALESNKGLKMSEEKKVETDNQVAEASLFHINTMAPHYQTITSFLTDNQFCLLRAIALAEVVQQPLSNEFIKRFELPSTSSVKSALTVLTEKDLVYQTSEGYIVYDRFLGLWLNRL